MSLRTWRRVQLPLAVIAVLFAYIVGGAIGALLLMGGWFLGGAAGLVMAGQIWSTADESTPSHVSSVIQDAFDPDKFYVAYDDGEVYASSDFRTADRPNWELIAVNGDAAAKQAIARDFAAGYRNTRKSL